MVQHLGGAETHAGHVDRHRAHHAPPARKLHGMPVRKGIGRQQIRRQHDERVVPVADFDRRQRHLLDVSVGAVLRDRDPVPDFEHVVGRELDARYESEDAVAEDQHQHGRRGPQPREQDGRRFVEQDRDDQDGADQRRNALRRLPQALDGFVLPRRARRGDMESGVKQGADEAEDRDDDIDLHEPHHDDAAGRFLLEDDRQHHRQQDSAQNVAHAVENRNAEKRVVPLGPGARDEFAHSAHDPQPQQQIEEHGGQHDQRESHPAVPAVIGGRGRAQPLQKRIGPAFQMSLHTPATTQFPRHGRRRKRPFYPSTSFTSPSKLGVKIPSPRFSRISCGDQKRPPSSSPLGRTGPSQTARKTWTNSRSRSERNS